MIDHRKQPASAPSTRPRAPRSLRVAALLAAAGGLALGVACSVPQRGALPAHLSYAQGKAPDGSLVFQSYCAECHGPRGEGDVEHPSIMGGEALASFPTAMDLHAYLEAHMPKLGKEELSADDYWTVTTFVVMAHGVPAPETGIDASNAPAIALHAE